MPASVLLPVMKIEKYITQTHEYMTLHVPDCLEGLVLI